MQKIIKTSFDILKANFIFIQPVLLYILFLMVAMTFLLTKTMYLQSKLVLLISLVLLTVAFTAGILQINKNGILNFNYSDTKEEAASKSIQNLKKFFEGVGKDFFRTLGIYFLTTILYALLTYGIGLACMHLWGEPKIILDMPKIARVSSQAELLNYLSTISMQDKIVFANWVLLFNSVFTFMNFFTLLYFAVSAFEKDNIFKTLFSSFVFFFQNILNSIIIMLFMFIIYLGLNFISLIFNASSFGFVIVTISLAIYLNYYILLVFYFYYETRKCNSNNRTEFIG